MKKPISVEKWDPREHYFCGNGISELLGRELDAGEARRRRPAQAPGHSGQDKEDDGAADPFVLPVRLLRVA